MAADFFKELLKNIIDYRECFYILLLSNSNHVLGYNQISLGGTKGTLVDIKFA
ncbi:MAG: hypothetical protein JEZ09_17555 [Salinivirgaceae bacterium]|nr:hypothetical protein [Salinivirgaceae bacterium]